jgi:hypothetical protein
MIAILRHPSRIPLLTLAVLFLIVLGFSPASAQAPAPNLQTYEQWLRESLWAAQRGDRLGLEEIAPNLIETTQVHLPDEHLMPVDNSWLRESLSHPDPDLHTISTRLAALLDALAQPASSAPPDAQEKLHDLLNRPPFARHEATEGENPLGRFFNWLGNLIADLLSPIGDVGGGSVVVIRTILIILGGVLVGGTLIYLLRSVRHIMRSEAKVATEKHPEAGLTAKSALTEATTLARSGDHRSAVRYLYLSSLLWLDERSLLRYDHALTNREYLQQVQRDDVREHLRPIVETFDRVWYGHMPVSAQDFTHYQQRVEHLHRIR